MAVPKQNELYRPLLEIAAETTDSLSHEDFAKKITVRLSLTENDLAEELPSGGSRLEKNIAFCVFNMTRGGALQKPSRGCFQITAAGHQLLKKHSSTITVAMVKRLVNQHSPNDMRGAPPVAVQTDVTTPVNPYLQTSSIPNDRLCNATNSEDKIKVGYRELQEQLTSNLLERISQTSPDGFERLVVDLLEKMGYGKGDPVGRSGDGGIDGIINQDTLGLEKVYMQAKRWQSQVGEPEIRNFAGSLDAKGASKGVLVTTSIFSGSATQTAKNISAGSKFIRLIDGPELARLMLEHDVGVITTYTYKIQSLDENYFSEEL